MRVQAVRRNWLPWHKRSGRINTTFTAESSDLSYLFSIDLESLWEQRASSRQRNPESMVIDHVMKHVERLATEHSLLQYKRLEHRANCLLGRPAGLADRIQVITAVIHVDPDPRDITEILTALRRHEAAKRANDVMRARIELFAMFRDHLRNDPTIALAQMLLETPSKVDSETLQTMESVASRIAAYAPGSETVAIAQSLKEFMENLDPDKKKYIIDRLYTVLIEFGARGPAERIQRLLQPEHGPAD
jgi:hypothetical protein